MSLQQAVQQAIERGVQPEDRMLIGVSFPQLEALLAEGALPVGPANLEVVSLGDNNAWAEEAAQRASLRDFILAGIGAPRDPHGTLFSIAHAVSGLGLEYPGGPLSGWRQREWLQRIQEVIDDFLPSGDPRRSTVTAEKVLTLARQCRAEERSGYVLALDPSRVCAGDDWAQDLLIPGKRIPAEAVVGIEPGSIKEWELLEARAC